MNTTKILAAALLASSLALPALAQTPTSDTGARPGNVIGSGNSLPTSDNASNGTAADTKSLIAPRLPAPGLPDGSDPHDFLVAARRALAANKTGEAQEALERAETRALAGNILASNLGDPSRQPIVTVIGNARRALASGDKATAMASIDQALQPR